MEDKILALIKRAPMSSNDIAKSIQKDTTIAGAYLSDLSSRKKVLVTHIRFGSSPFYYLPENRAQLTSLSRYLDPKDMEVYNHLSEKKILREKELQLLPRVALRNMKDFAVQLNIIVDGNKEIFWKWYMLSDEEAEVLIREILENLERKNNELRKISEEQIRRDEEIKRAQDIKNAEILRAEEIKRLEKLKEDEIRKAEELKRDEIRRVDELRKIEEISKKNEELRMTQESKLNAFNDEIKKKLELLEKMNRALYEKFESMTKKLDNQNNDFDMYRKDVDNRFRKLEDENLKMSEKVQGQIVAVQEPDKFLEYVNEYCVKNKFSVIETNVVKREKEIDMIIMLNGTKYFFKAKNKKKCNETDVVGAYVIGNEKNMPVMFLSGELTKKASEMLNNELNNKVFYKNLD